MPAAAEKTPLSCLYARTLHPRIGRFLLSFKIIDLANGLQRDTNIVETFEQTMFAEWINVEMHFLPIWTNNFLVFQINLNARVLAASGVFEQRITLFRFEVFEVSFEV